MKYFPPPPFQILAMMALLLLPSLLFAEEVVLDEPGGRLEVRAEVTSGLPGIAGADFTVSISVVHNDTGSIPVASTFVISYDKTSVDWLGASPLQMGRAFVGEEREADGRVERVVMAAGSMPMNTLPTPGCFSIRFRTVENPTLPFDIRVMPPGGANFGLVASDLRTGLHPDIDDSATRSMGANLQGARRIHDAEYEAMTGGHRWIALVVGDGEPASRLAGVLAGEFGFDVRQTPATRSDVTAALESLAADTTRSDRVLLIHSGTVAPGAHGLGEWALGGGALGCPELYAAFGRMEAGEVLILANACSPSLTSTIQPPVSGGSGMGRLHFPPPMEGADPFLGRLESALLRIPRGVVMPVEGVASLLEMPEGIDRPRLVYFPGHGGGTFHFLRQAKDQ